ncbi:Guanine nucleotide exchange protein smcr8, partial [Haplosporangium sp. Z 27]
MPTESRPHKRTPGAISFSEINSPLSASSPRPHSAPKAGGAQDSISNGLKTPLSSSSENQSSGSGSRGCQFGLSLDPPSMGWWCSKRNADLPDFVLISEFSEVEGPRAVMTIPDNIIDLTRDSYSSLKHGAQESSTKHSQEHSDMINTTLASEGNNALDTEDMFDIHEFVLRITCVDQQARESSGIFHIPEDIEIHISDTEKGYWAYVHHFTLFDINARGFVRPFCLSYVTRDPSKILANYDNMRRKFTRAALYFKTGNYTLFRQDLTKKLRDLNYTNNLLSEAPVDVNNSNGSPTEASPSVASSPIETRQDAFTQQIAEPLEMPKDRKDSEERQQGSLTEQQKADLESIKDAIETATHIISMLEHYSVDGQPLLGHAEDANEGPQSMAPLSDLSPMTSSENLAMLAAGRSGPSDPTLFLGATSRTGSRIRRKGSTPSFSGATQQRILDSSGTELYSAPLPHLLGLQQEPSRKNSVVSDYDSMMYEAPEYEAQYVTSLYPTYRDEVVFRPLRELCIANMVWNSSIQFHLGIKKIKDILKEFQTDSQLLGEAADNVKRMHPTCSTLTVGQRVTTRSMQLNETLVPLAEPLQGIPLANTHSEDELSTQEALLSGAQESPAAATFGEPRTEERRAGLTLEDDADDEQTGYDSLDDAASFFTAATGVAVHGDTPTRDSFVIAPLDRSVRVAEWHQEQQTLHRAKGDASAASSHAASNQLPWSFGAGVAQGEQPPQSGAMNRVHRQSAQSGTSIGITATGTIPSHCPTFILDTLQKNPTLAKHLVFALLSGQKVCVMGLSENESKVRALISVLASFLPHVGYPTREEQLIEHQRQVVMWYQGHGPLKVEDMEKVLLVGVDSSKIDPKFLESDICVLDYDTLTLVNGRQYTDGMFLEPIFRSMSVFSEDSSFIAFVDGRLFDILLKSFLYYHLVFRGRLYHSGLLAHLGAQAFYSSGGASDDGEAFTYQNNFLSSRQSPIARRNSVTHRANRRNMSAYPSSTHLGATVGYKGSRPASLYSHESSDVERSLGQGETQKPSKREVLENSRHHYYEKTMQERLVMSGDESGQGGGPMQYATSHGMRKWKKWFEFFTTGSAVTDPAQTIFGRSDSVSALDGISRRKRNGSRKSSPHRRPKSSSSHIATPGRHREVREREKERDRERERERDRKSTFSNFERTKEKIATSHSSDSESVSNNGYNEDTKENKSMFEKEVIMEEKDRIEHVDSKIEAHTDSRVDESHTNLLSPVMKTPSGLRKLKPKRPLMLSRSTSKANENDGDQGGGDASMTTANGEVLKRSPSSGSLGSHSSALRSLRSAIRAMSFGNSASTSNGLEAGDFSLSRPRSASRHSSEMQHSPRNSREFSDPNQKDIKRRGSTRAKAKAWLKSKRKRKSRIHEDGQLEIEPSNENDNDEDLSDEEEDQESDQDVGESPQQAEESGLTIRDLSKSAPASTLTSSTLAIVPPPHSLSSSDLTEMPRQQPQVPGLTLEAPLTIQEIALLEPTRKAPQMLAPSSGLSTGNSSSRVSSTAPSRITSPTVLSFAAGNRPRLGSLSGTRPALIASATSQGLASLPAETRSEHYDSEYDLRRDPGRESATEYETSQETFAGMESGNVSSIGREGGRSVLAVGRTQSVDSFGRKSLDTSTVVAVTAGADQNLESSKKTIQPQVEEKELENKQDDKEHNIVVLTEEEESAVRELLGGVTGADDWAIIV